MKKIIDLSIIIVNFKTYSYLENCLRSIFDGIVNTINFEVIVFDNGADGRRIVDMAKKFPTTYISSKKNIGFSRANNLCIKKSSGKFVLFLNPDTKLPRDAIKKMVVNMESRNNTAVATCLVKLPNGEIDDACHRGFPTPWNSFCHFTGISRLFPKNRFLNGYHLGYREMDKEHQIDSCSGCFLVVKREIGNKINWFDEDYFWYGEDIDFCYRIKLNGGMVMFYPDVYILHYKGVSSGIKKNTSDNKVSKKIKIESTIARFEVMRVFYRKHYLTVYHPIIMKMVFFAINILEKYNLLKFHLIG